MRKNFLLMLLMTLLPLVGWAQDSDSTIPVQADKPSVAINLAYIYKYYGEADPTDPAKFEFEIASVSDENVTVTKEDIASYLVFKRATGSEGEDVREYEYYYDFTPEYYTTCQYKIIPLQTKSLLIIQKAPLTIKVDNNYKKYKQVDPEFTWTISEENLGQLKNGDTADDLEILITREEGEPVNADLNEEGKLVFRNQTGYAFKGETKNYEITFENSFGIIPSDDYSGITVTITNSTTNEDGSNTPETGTSSYIYTGEAITPGLGDNYSEDLIVKDGDNVLVAGEDYKVLTADNYANNIHVGTATVTVTLTGSYVEHQVTGEFTIKKAPLTITAKSYELGVGADDPANFEVTYDGFVNNETAETAKDFKAPSGVEKVAIPGSSASTLKVIEDAEAADYEITYADGAITFGETILIVTADNKTKTYGDDDPEFTVTVKQADGSEATDTQKATLTIGGTTAYTASREEGENVGGGSQNGAYPITLDGPTVLLDGVVVVYNGGTLTITPKTVTLRGGTDDGSAVTKVYGDANPTFDAVVYETIGDEETQWTREKMNEEGVVNGTFYYVGVQGARWNGTTWVLPSENVTPEDGGYAVTPSLFGTNITTSGNYLVVTEGGVKFTITPAPLTITADDKNVNFGGAEELLTITAEGLKFNDQLEIERDYTISREEGDAVGTYAITVATVEGSTVLANYDVTLVPGTYTISAAALEVVANDQAIPYGGTINPYDVKILINGEDAQWTEEQIAAVLSLSTDVTSIGYHKNAYTLNKVENANYTIADDAFTNGWLTIGQLKVIPLDKDELAQITDNSLQQVLEDHKGMTVAVKMPKRTMKANDWYSWVLPFEVNPEDLFDKGTGFGYGALEILDEEKSVDGNVVFSLQVQNIPANTPFIAKIKNEKVAEKVNSIIFNNVTIGEQYYLNENPTSAGDGVKFIGLYEENAEPLDASTRILRRLPDASQPLEFWSGNGATLPRTYAYLQFQSEAAADAARILIQEPDGTYTAIQGVVADGAKTADGWYSVNGMKLNAAPTQKGVYVKDGKKVVVK